VILPNFEGPMLLTETARALNNDPTYLFFTVTSRCNAFCDFCWNWKNVLDAGKLHRPGDPILRPELSLAEIESITIKLPPMLVVNLFGGEPFVRNDLYEIMELFVKNCDTKYISIPTNSFLTEKVIDDVTRVTKAFPQTFFKIYISLDGPALEHDKLRKVKDGYQKLMNTTKALVELRKDRSNLSLSCNINFNNRTQHYMKDFVQEVMNWKYFDSISVDLVRGELFDPTMLDTDQNLYQEVQDIVKNYKLFSEQPFSPLHKAIEQKTAETIRKALKRPEERVFNCFAGKKILILSDTGEVSACEHMLEKVMGNVRNFDYDLMKLLESETAKKIRQDIVDKKCNCRWECAINTSNIFDLKNYPDLILKTAANMIFKKA
jgi:MoaA/NifB/PqqE/SkfB family radical SAM enzyme